MLRLAFAVGGAVLALVSVPARATPFTLDHLIAIERLGQVALSPDGSNLAFERVAPLNTASDFEYDALGPVLRTSVFLSGKSSLAEPRLLLDDVDGRGVVIGGWSPDGRRLLVYRLGDRNFTAGVTDVASGVVRWLAGTPESAIWGRAAQWRGSDELVMILRPDGDLPALMRQGFQPEECSASAPLAQIWGCG